MPKDRHKHGTVQAENKYQRSIKLLMFLNSALDWLLKFVYRKIVDVVFSSLAYCFSVAQYRERDGGQSVLLFISVGFRSKHLI